MIVKNLKKNKNKYIVTIDNTDYTFSENIIVKYRLVKGKEIDNQTLKSAISENHYDSLYLKAERYAINYRKSEKEIVRYLKNKECDNQTIQKIVSKLRSLKLIDDSSLVIDLANSLVKKYNGKKMIEAKLKEKGINDELIDMALDNIDYDLYINYLEKLYLKVKDKYNKFDDDYIRINKIKAYLISRGYSYNDIALIKIK
ncbi:MAG: RecX family transcriptional regulator [Acholeplasmatales bacterium]|nr:RecX family transcriptional regulator [Acholeplasmatales bacterium]